MLDEPTRLSRSRSDCNSDSLSSPSPSITYFHRQASINTWMEKEIEYPKGSEVLITESNPSTKPVIPFSTLPIYTWCTHERIRQSDIGVFFPSRRLPSISSLKEFVPMTLLYRPRGVATYPLWMRTIKSEKGYSFGSGIAHLLSIPLLCFVWLSFALNLPA